LRSAVGSGKTLEEAVAEALARLGAQPEQVELRKLEDASSGLLGNTFRPYRVRATWLPGLGPTDAPAAAGPTVYGAPRPAGERRDRRDEPPTAFRSMETVLAPKERPAPARRYTPPSPEERFEVDAAFLARVRETARWLLDGMGFAETTIEVTGEADEATVSLTDEANEPLLSGRRGDTRIALAQVLSRLANPRRGPGAHVMVDVNGYWRNRRELLVERAKEMAERALSSGEEVSFEPLASEERRVVHRALNDDSRVVTESFGSGALKRVAIRAADRG
jgi:spoIIIJ-associated protein